jgi:hypothetical protein
MVGTVYSQAAELVHPASDFLPPADTSNGYYSIPFLGLSRNLVPRLQCKNAKGLPRRPSMSPMQTSKKKFTPPAQTSTHQSQTYHPTQNHAVPSFSLSLPHLPRTRGKLENGPPTPKSQIPLLDPQSAPPEQIARGGRRAQQAGQEEGGFLGESGHC